MDSHDAPIGVEGVYCAICECVWFGPGGLSRHCERMGDLPDLSGSLAVSSATGLRCPSCIEGSLDRLPWTPPTESWIHRCPGCRGTWVDESELVTIRARALVMPVMPPTPLQPALKVSDVRPYPTPYTEMIERFGIPYDSWWLNRLALPIAFVLAALLHAILPSGPQSMFGELLHHTGHVAAAWSAGLPVFLERTAWLTVAPSPALIAPIGVWSLMVMALGARIGLPMVFLPGATIAVLQIVLLAIPTEELRGSVILAAGISAEFVLSAFFVGAFYYRLPRLLRWDALRFIGLLLGAAWFTHITAQWWEIMARPELLVWGTDVAGAAEAGRDLQQLRTAFEWGRPQLLLVFPAIAGASAVWIAAHYLAGLALSRSR